MEQKHVNKVDKPSRCAAEGSGEKEDVRRWKEGKEE